MSSILLMRMPAIGRAAMVMPAVRMAVRSTATVTMAMAVAMEEKQPDEVDDEAGDADVEQWVDVLDLVVAIGEALERLDEDREAERDEKDGVDERAEYLGSCPSVRVFLRVKLRYLAETNMTKTEKFIDILCSTTYSLSCFVF